MDAQLFGQTAEGQGVHRVTIEGGGLRAAILSWGAVLQDLRLDGHDDPLVLGFEAFDHYPAHSPHFGAIVGRYANRIRDGRFTIDGKSWQADQNFLDKHTLHGGAAGIGRQVWTLAETGADFVTLKYRAVDGEMGFPGNLDLTCTYALKETGRLCIELTATTDAPTLCNLAHHSYFNLDDGGRSDVLSHQMQIAAGAYLPVDDELIPTGAVIPVEGTDFDFRKPRPIRNGDTHRPYDHNFCLSSDRVPLRPVVHVMGARSGVAMELWTTEPGVQFYDAAHVARDVPGLNGIIYGAHTGFCLEPQVWPDAPNRPYFPQSLLRPGERYSQTTEYRFRMAG